MSEKRINFKERGTETFLGRNGSFKCVGVDVWAGSTGIWIEPVTSRGKTGRCWIEIPVKDANKVAKAINEIVRWKKAAERRTLQEAK